MLNTIWFRFELIRFQKYFSVCLMFAGEKYFLNLDNPNQIWINEIQDRFLSHPDCMEFFFPPIWHVAARETCVSCHHWDHLKPLGQHGNMVPRVFFGGRDGGARGPHLGPH